MDHDLLPNRKFTMGLLRCVQLREWKLAEVLLARSANRDDLRRYASSILLLHLCADAGDLEGVTFLCRSTSLSIDGPPPPGTVFKEDTPLEAALKA